MASLFTSTAHDIIMFNVCSHILAQSCNKAIVDFGPIPSLEET